MNRLAAISLILACVGCAPDSNYESVAAAQSAFGAWEATLHCGGHGVVVDVDSAERRHLQAVVRDPGAVAWLSQHPGDGGAGTPNARGEIILSGFVQPGVFSPNDFTSFNQEGFSITDAVLPEAHVHRDGNGLRVSLVSWASGSEMETANWWFADCR